MPETWDIQSAISLYNIDRWGTGYFTINQRGNIQILPTQSEKTPIDIMEVIAGAQERGGGQRNVKPPESSCLCGSARNGNAPRPNEEIWTDRAISQEDNDKPRILWNKSADSPCMICVNSY